MTLALEKPPWLLTPVSLDKGHLARVIAGLSGAARRAAIPVLIGVVAFFVVTGGRTLDLRNIAWLASADDDEATYFLGWHFYRHSPWGFPIGVSPRYGAELANSIAFVDNVPLFAFPFKVLAPWLPDPLQYFGLWTLLCFVLHAWFAWLLVGLLTEQRLARACGTALFVFAPPFLWRLSGHFQMEGQWMILAGLYLTFGPRRLARGYAWPLLALTMGLVHSYMSAMILGLWGCDLLRRWLFEGGPKRADFLQIVLVPVLTWVGFWQAGLFMMGKGITKSGFGYYRMNLTTLFDPSGWSYFLKDIPEGRGDYEGFAYLGLGGLLLLVLSLPTLKTAWPALRSRRRYWPLLAFLVGLTLFSISHKIGLAAWNYEIPLSQEWVDRANVLRTGGRMFWPAFYVIVWLVLRAVLRFYPARIAAGALLVAVLAQVVDTSAGWRPIREHLMVTGTTWPSPLKSAFWSKVPSNYSEIRMVLPANKERNYAHFAYFASMNGMSTDAVYFARIDEAKLRQARSDAMAAVNRAKYAPGALYILDRRYEKAARASVDPERDLLERIDGFPVLAPGFRCRKECQSNPSADYCSASCAR